MATLEIDLFKNQILSLRNKQKIEQHASWKDSRRFLEMEMLVSS